MQPRYFDAAVAQYGEAPSDEILHETRTLEPAELQREIDVRCRPRRFHRARRPRHRQLLRHRRRQLLFELPTILAPVKTVKVHLIQNSLVLKTVEVHLIQNSLAACVVPAGDQQEVV